MMNRRRTHKSLGEPGRSVSHFPRMETSMGRMERRMEMPVGRINLAPFGTEQFSFDTAVKRMGGKF
jgi:hypothetical protein